jgi:hypothetical protein
MNKDGASVCTDRFGKVLFSNFLISHHPAVFESQLQEEKSQSISSSSISSVAEITFFFSGTAQWGL